MRPTCAVIMICATAIVVPGFAQNPGEKKTLAPQPCDDLAKRGPNTKEDKKQWPCPPPPDKVTNIEDGTKRALACEWVDPTAVRHVLEALRFYTIPELKNGRGLRTPSESAKEALNQLIIKGDPKYTGLYTAATGDPDEQGEPRAQGLPDFLDDLAEANTQNLNKPENEDDLFKQAGAKIDQIFASPEGPQELVKIKDLFAQEKHVALYELLKAYPGYDTDPEQPATQDYACSLETLRAAYQMKADRLQEVVIEKVTGPKK